MTQVIARNPLTAFLGLDGAAPERGGPASGVGRILSAVRAHLGMEIAFASRVHDGRREFTHLDADFALPAGPGDSEPLGETYCGLVLDRQLPELIRDTSEHPAALALPITGGLPLGAQLTVPMRLSDGRLYGTMCCVSRHAEPSMTERDLATLRAFAELAVGLIEQDLAADEGRAATEARVRGALSARSLSILYQPIQRLANGRMIGVEALARFADGRSPDRWFADAAAVGLGSELELLAIEEALHGRAALPRGLALSLNTSAETLSSGALETVLRRAPRGRLVVEITEHSDVEDLGTLRAAMDSLRDLVRFAIDDVGAGYSGLRRVLDLKPDAIKLDMELTRDIDRDPARGALATAMVGFAAGIGAAIVAEGVENEEELAELRRLGVRLGQGYHLGRPMTALALQRLVLGGTEAAPVSAAPVLTARATAGG